MIGRLLGGLVAGLLTGFTRLLTGAQARWIGCAPVAAQRIYFGNHASHADFVLIWSSLPPELRRITRPVAGADYWEKGPVRRFLIHHALNGVLVDRARKDAAADPIGTMAQALDEGASLIIFPEGTRNTTEDPLLPFKSGLYHLGRARPQAELVPVWMENQGRVLPKGETIPVPLLCSINFGAPLQVGADEDKARFLERARQALLDVAAQARPS
jgi:1-acyl-sn-glycerol-3-phosphate acyltransferase